MFQTHLLPQLRPDPLEHDLLLQPRQLDAALVAAALAALPRPGVDVAPAAAAHRREVLVAQHHAPEEGAARVAAVAAEREARLLAAAHLAVGLGEARRRGRNRVKARGLYITHTLYIM